jgi:hypothetical protein
MRHHMALMATPWLPGDRNRWSIRSSQLQARCVLMPLILLIALATYGTRRPLFEIMGEEW